MRIFITGIDGFVGAALAKFLVQKGHDVAGNDATICHTGLTELATFGTDCRSFMGMRSDLLGWKPHVVVHAAATAHEGLSSFSPAFVTKNIFDASVATFSAAIAAGGVKRIVYLSSMARYGRQSPPFNEDLTPQPVDPYGIAKAAAENVLRVLCETHGIKWCVLVPHNIIGPGQKYDDPYRNVAAIMINRALQGLPIQVYGEGCQIRCFSPINDILPCIERAIEGAADDQIVNIGPDRECITISDLSAMVQKWIDPRTSIVHLPPRPNEVAAAYCTAGKARRLLGYEQKTPVGQCVYDMIEFIREKGTRPFIKFAPVEIDSPLLPKGWRE